MKILSSLNRIGAAGAAGLCLLALTATAHAQTTGAPKPAPAAPASPGATRLAPSGASLDGPAFQPPAFKPVFHTKPTDTPLPKSFTVTVNTDGTFSVNAVSVTSKTDGGKQETVTPSSATPIPLEHDPAGVWTGPPTAGDKVSYQGYKGTVSVDKDTGLTTINWADGSPSTVITVAPKGSTDQDGGRAGIAVGDVNGDGRSIAAPPNGGDANQEEGRPLIGNGVSAKKNEGDANFEKTFQDGNASIAAPKNDGEGRPIIDNGGRAEPSIAATKNGGDGKRIVVVVTPTITPTAAVANGTALQTPPNGGGAKRDKQVTVTATSVQDPTKSATGLATAPQNGGPTNPASPAEAAVNTSRSNIRHPNLAVAGGDPSNPDSSTGTKPGIKIADNESPRPGMATAPDGGYKTQVGVMAGTITKRPNGSTDQGGEVGLATPPGGAGGLLFGNGGNGIAATPNGGDAKQGFTNGGVTHEDTWDATRGIKRLPNPTDGGDVKHDGVVTITTTMPHGVDAKQPQHGRIYSSSPVTAVGQQEVASTPNGGAAKHDVAVTVTAVSTQTTSLGSTLATAPPNGGGAKPKDAVYTAASTTATALNGDGKSTTTVKKPPSTTGGDSTLAHDAAINTTRSTVKHPGIDAKPTTAMPTAGQATPAGTETGMLKQNPGYLYQTPLTAVPVERAIAIANKPGQTGAAERKQDTVVVGYETQKNYLAPRAIDPSNGKEFGNEEIKRPITFRWTPIVPKPSALVVYRLRVWQLMQGQSGAQALRANQPIITKDVDNITQALVTNVITGPCKPPYLCDFVWTVQALDREGKPIGSNDGTSEAFRYTFATGMTK